MERKLPTEVELGLINWRERFEEEIKILYKEKRYSGKETKSKKKTERNNMRRQTMYIVGEDTEVKHVENEGLPDLDKREKGR